MSPSPGAAPRGHAGWHRVANGGSAHPCAPAFLHPRLARGGIASRAGTCTPAPGRAPGEQARSTPCAPPAGNRLFSSILLTTWQPPRCLMLSGKRQLARAQSKMSPKCHSNFLSVHKMADAPFQQRVGLSSEQRHLAPLPCPPCHRPARARGAEGHGCHRAGRRAIIALGEETVPGPQTGASITAFAFSSLAGVRLAAKADLPPFDVEAHGQ